MVAFIQFLLSLVILTLTFLIALVGVQVFFILHEIRSALHKINRLLDHSQAPQAAVETFFSEVKNLVHQTEDQIIDSTPDRVVPPSRLSRIHRFFRRSGVPLHPS